MRSDLLLNVTACQTPMGQECAYGPYLMCGWKVYSALPLPELESSQPVPEDLQCSVLELALRQESRTGGSEQFSYALESTGEFLLQLPGLAEFRISADAARVTVLPALGADPQLLRAHFYGSVVAVVCFMRGLLPLHGSCVQVENAAVIFSGPSGAGKSTLAAAFARAGYGLLCDDVCAITLHPGAPARVWPAFPRLKLLPDAIEAFSLDRDVLYTRAARGEKGHYMLPNDAAKAGMSLPIRGIYLLDERSTSTIDIRLLKGANAFLPLKTQIHRASMASALGLRAQAFQDLSTLLQTVPVYQLDRPKGLQSIHEVVTHLVQSQRTTASESSIL